MQAQLARTRNRKVRPTGRRSLPVVDVLRLLAPLGAGGPRDGCITEVTCDSRKAVPGSCFVAVDGEKIDGHAFVASAIRNGAGAVVLQRPCDIPEGVTAVLVEDTRKAAALLACAFYGHPSRKMSVIGITGTHGKTTTAYMLRHLAEFSGRKAGMLTTVKYDTGARVVTAPQTTPLDAGRSC
jgi:UDP-N-acetylmuramoyl-L-alanyl-D-glutamate--2,6-diaminopimelate ligase